MFLVGTLARTSHLQGQPHSLGSVRATTPGGCGMLLMWETTNLSAPMLMRSEGLPGRVIARSDTPAERLWMTTEKDSTAINDSLRSI